MGIRKTVNAPLECKTCSRWKVAKERIRVAQLLEKALTLFEKRMTEQDFKPSVGDYLKLMQMEKEFEESETKEIRVTWVDPREPSDSEK
jgi:hypothetical protein